MSDENQLRPGQVDQARADFAALKSEDIEAIYARFGVPPPAHVNRTALGIILCIAILAIPLGWFLVQHHRDKPRAVMKLMLAAYLLWALILAYIKGKIPYGRAFFRVLIRKRVRRYYSILYRLPVMPRCGRVNRQAYHVWGMDDAGILFSQRTGGGRAAALGTTRERSRVPAGCDDREHARGDGASGSGAAGWAEPVSGLRMA